MKKVMLIILISILIPTFIAQTSDNNQCGFFCQINNFFKEIFAPQVEVEPSSDSGNGDGKELRLESESKINKEEVTSDKKIDTDLKNEQIAETDKEAIEQQIEIVSEKIIPDSIESFETNGLCKITLNKETILPHEDVVATFTFDESLKGKKVALACDQYERNKKTGESGDEPWEKTIPNSLTTKESCDYGRVTTPTLYFWFAYNEETNENYCISSVTVLPKKGDEGECFDETKKQEIINECKKQGKSYYSIKDTNDCQTYYCGFVSCPDISKAEEDCLADGNTPVKYSVDIEGIDWPCAQVRCSKCPSSEELLETSDKCLSKGDGYDPSTEEDFNTGCKYIKCNPPGYQQADSESPITAKAIKESDSEKNFLSCVKNLFN